MSRVAQATRSEWAEGATVTRCLRAVPAGTVEQDGPSPDLLVSLIPVDCPARPAVAPGENHLVIGGTSLPSVYLRL